MSGENPTGPDASISSKGITTLHKDYRPVLSINRDSETRPLYSRQPCWALVKKVDFLEGVSLNRVVVVSRKPNYMRCIVRVASDAQRVAGCDRCIRSHRPTNRKCSATIGIRSNASLKNRLYVFENTKLVKTKWRRISWEIRGRDRVGTAEYVSSDSLLPQQ